MNSVSLPKLELLQVLRAIAAISVVFCHTYYLPGYGAYGVSIFFVLSGVIMAMLFEVNETPFQFIFRRCIRIVPLYWITTTIFATAFLIKTSGVSPTRIDFLKSLFFIPFAQANGGIHPVLVAGWTLNYEMAFYLSCFWGLIFSKKYPLISTVFLMIFWNSLASLSPTVFGAFYKNPLVLYFIAGIVIWKMGRIVSWRFKSEWALISIPILCSFIAYLEYSSKTKIETIKEILLKVLLVNLAVFFGLFSEPAFQRMNSKFRMFLVSIGDASYAIYLTHTFVIYLLPFFGIMVGINKDSLTLALISIVISTFTGIGVHRYFDVPIQKRLKRLVPKN